MTHLSRCLPPDHEGECEVLAGVEDVVPAGVLHQDLLDVADRLVRGARVHDVSAPNLTATELRTWSVLALPYLELRHVLAEGDVEQPVQALLGQPGLVQGQLPDVSRVPGVGLLHQHT